MNPRVVDIPGSLIRRIAALKRVESVDLGLGEPSLLPTQAHLDWAMEYVARHGMKYTPNAGQPELREAIAGGNSCMEADVAADIDSPIPAVMMTMART